MMRHRATSTTHALNFLEPPHMLKYYSAPASPRLQRVIVVKLITAMQCHTGFPLPILTSSSQETGEGFWTSLQQCAVWLLDFLPASGHGSAHTRSVMIDGSCNSIPGWHNCRCYTSNPFLYLPKLFASVRCFHHLL